MATVDIEVSCHIPSTLDVVSAYACNPEHAPDWYVNIQSMNWVTDPPARVGSRMEFVAHFLGRRLSYTYEVVKFEPGVCMQMRTSEGPFPMETTYTFEDAGAKGTRMSLRNLGEPSGFAAGMAPMMRWMMRRAMTADLAAITAKLTSSERDA